AAAHSIGPIGQADRATEFWCGSSASISSYTSNVSPANGRHGWARASRDSAPVDRSDHAIKDQADSRSQGDLSVTGPIRTAVADRLWTGCARTACGLHHSGDAF